jgi:hypothetical protein
MAIARMTVCEWRGSSLERQIVPNPTLDQVEAAVRRLDNQRFNDLYLEPSGDEPDTWLCIGGGAGRYLLSGALANQRFPTLVDPTRAADPAETLVVGGQEGTYPANRVHNLGAALEAVRAFWRSGRFEDPGLLWIES